MGGQGRDTSLVCRADLEASKNLPKDVDPENICQAGSVPSVLQRKNSCCPRFSFTKVFAEFKSSGKVSSCLN